LEAPALLPWGDPAFYVEKMSAALRAGEHDEFIALVRGLRAATHLEPGSGWSRSQAGCYRKPRTDGRSGCTPAEPYPPDREGSLATSPTAGEFNQRTAKTSTSRVGDPKRSATPYRRLK